MIIDKIKKLGGKTCATPVKNAARRLERLETEIKQPLPADYRKYLLEFAAPVSFNTLVRFKPKKKVPFAGKDGTLSLDALYGFGKGWDSLEKALETYDGRLPKNVIPIGGLPGGNLLCLCFAAPHREEVYFWDHENEINAQMIPHRSFKNMFLVSRSFAEFINSIVIEVEDLEKPLLTPEELGKIKCWLDF